MSDKLGTYTFLPWLRQGIANKIQAADMDVAVKLRASINVKLNIVGQKVDGGELVETIDKDVKLYGPGDIVGIDSKNIIRSEPRNWITNFEPNYLPYIDFYDEDFPWRYTPAVPDNTKDRLRPWLSLVVLKEDEFSDGNNVSGKPLPFLQLKANTADVFPAEEELWAWAHVHVNEGLISGIVAQNADKQSVINKFKAVLDKDPDLAYSRIICPRKLEANVAYHAFLVPSFESGRLAGLGADTTTAPFATSSAWQNYGGKLEPEYYPYYHRWYFRTGDVGDFEYLVRLLEPKPVDSRVGVRDMDVQNPGSNIPGINDPDLGGILKLGGALRIPYDSMADADQKEFDKFDKWDDNFPEPFQQDLAKFINLPDDYAIKAAEQANIDTNIDGIKVDPDPLITVPLYGRWHALTQRALYKEDGSNVPNNRNWVHDLNLDPRYRVAAGFGTGVVQENQEDYMSAAWKQVGDVLEANRKMRQAELAKQASWWWYNKTIKPITENNPNKSLLLAAPLHARVIAGDYTVRHQFNTSRNSASLASVAMRKITRPGSRMMRTLVFDNTIKATNLISRVNEGTLNVVKPKEISTEVPNIDQVTQEMMPKKVPDFYLKFLVKNNKWFKWVLIALLLIIAALAIIFKIPLVSRSIMGLIVLLLIWLFVNSLKWGKQAVAADSLSEENLKPDAVDDLPKVSNFKIKLNGEQFKPRNGLKDSKEGSNFKSALSNSFGLIEASKSAGINPPKPSLDLNLMINTTIKAIDPELTIPKLIYNSIYIPDRIKLKLIETFVEAMAYPEFDLPMYKPLVNISTDLFLPNIQLIGQNTISLLETNQKFIEAYMVGLNHEFARELLWREYPTDQRGSYFRQFWDVTSFYDDAETDLEELKEKLRDIPPLHLWSKSSNLGDHDHREEGKDNEEELVLVIRGELLKKYPNAVIYAHRAEWQLNDDNEIDNTQERRLVTLLESEEENPPKTKIKTPLYEAKVNPDITFFGFDLTAAEAEGGKGDNPTDDPGWFFVIKERPGEPRFGLDIDSDTTPNTWNDLSWSDILPEGSAENFIRINNASESINLVEPVSAEDQEKVVQWEDDQHISWNKNMNAAEVAYILYQVPVLVAVHAAEMLPKD